MSPSRLALEPLAAEALSIGDVASAAVFVVEESCGLELAAAAGIDGAPLAGLVAAVRNPAHPVARAVDDPGPAFDVRPMNPGGPALRSHVPLRSANGPAVTFGVLALAHESPLSGDDRERVLELSRRLADTLASEGRTG